MAKGKGNSCVTEHVLGKRKNLRLNPWVLEGIGLPYCCLPGPIGLILITIQSWVLGLRLR